MRKKSERIFTHFLHLRQRVHPRARSCFREFRYLRISRKRERESESKVGGENSSRSVKKLRKRYFEDATTPETLLSLVRGRALVGKSFFKLPGLFQRASLIIAARISFYKTSFAREISLRFFVPGPPTFVTADFRKGAFNFHLRREVSKKLLWIR